MKRILVGKKMMLYQNIYYITLYVLLVASIIVWITFTKY